MRNSLAVFVMLSVVGCSDSNERSAAPELIDKVVTGRLEGISENAGAWVWGDGANSLCQGWSIPGFFYGTESPASSADVAVLIAPDILELNNAESLNYESDSVYAQSGDTVVFRGRNGFFGAWKIEEITPDGLLYGTWYFRSGGGGDFTTDLVEADSLAPVPAASCRNIG